MTQGGPPPPPNHHFMSGGLPAMGDFGNFTPMQEFTNPFPADARRSRQMDPEDLPQRVTTRDPGGEMYLERKPSQSRNRSNSRPSILKRESTSGVQGPVDYELWRIEKYGDDWTDAVQKQLPGSQKDLIKKARSRSKNGAAIDQIQKMGPNRLGQIDDVVDRKYKQTGFRWEPAWIEEVKSSISRNNKKDVRIFDVIIARAGLNAIRPSSLPKPRTNSVSTIGGQRVILKDRTNTFSKDYDSEKKDKKEKDGGKQGGKKEVSDPDPFGTSKLFASNGKPLEHNGKIPFDEIALPPHIQEEQPIGRLPPKRRGGKSHHGDDDIVEVIGEDAHGGPEVIEDLDFDHILPKGKNKKGKKGLSRSRSRSRATAGRDRSKSHSRARAHAEHRGKRGERVDRYMDDHSSGSSDTGSGRSNFFDEYDDEDTSITSSGVHRGMASRGSLHRRGSSKHKDLPFREHYRGPAREMIMIPERPIRRLSNAVYPQQKAIGYGDAYLSGPRSPKYGIPELLYPHEVRQEDQRSERYVDTYMQEDRLHDLRQRELDDRERALERKERELRMGRTQRYNY